MLHETGSEKIKYTESDDLSKATQRKLFWRLIPIIFLSLILNQLDKINIAFAKLQMSHDVGLSPEAYGFGAGIFFVGYCAFEIPSNIMLYRTGARYWISRILLSWGIISACMMFVDSKTTFYVFRFLLGVAEAGFAPGLILYISEWFPVKKRGQMIAAFMLAIPISGIVGAPLSTFLMTSVPFGISLHGWQWMFLLEGIPAVILGFLFWFFMPDRIDDATWLDVKEKAALKASIGESNQESHNLGFIHGLVNSKVWILCLIYFLLVAALYGVSFWLPTIIRDLGVQNIRQIGLVAAIPFIMAAIAMPLLSSKADRTGKNKIYLAMTALVGAAGLILSVLLQESSVLSFVVLAIGAAAIFAFLPLFWTLPTMILRGKSAATGFALITCIGNLGGFFAPYLMGTVTSAYGSVRFGVVGLAVCAILSAVAIAFLPHKIDKQ